MTSVNTNAAALTALRTLQNTNNQLESVQSRISTGFKIGEAKDNAAYWAISTTLKSDNKSLATVKDALGLGASTVDTAYQGLNKAKDVLDEIKSKLTAATQDGVNRDTIQQEIGQLQQQLKSIASSSVFSGENWLSVDSSAVSYSANKSVVASFSRDASGSVSIGTIGVDTTNVALFDASTATGAGGILNGKVNLVSNGRDLAFGGASTATGNTALGGLKVLSDTGVSAVAITDTGEVGTKATATLGTGYTTITGISTLNTAQPTDGVKVTVTTDLGTNVDINVTYAALLTADGVAAGGNNDNDVSAAEFVKAFNTVAAGVPTAGVEAFIEGTAVKLRRTDGGELKTFTAATVTALNAGGATGRTAGLTNGSSFTTGSGEAKITSTNLNLSGLAATDKVQMTFRIDGADKVVTVVGATDTTDKTQFAADLNTKLGLDGTAKIVNGELVMTGRGVGTGKSIQLVEVSYLTTLNVVKEPTVATGLPYNEMASAKTDAFGGSFALTDADDKIQFDIKVNSATTSTLVTVDKALIDKTLNRNTGVISSAAEYATVLTAALTNAKVTGVTVKADAGQIVFATTQRDATASIDVANVTATNGAKQISVDKIDISANGLSTVGVTTSDQIKTALKAYIEVVNGAINKITSAAASLGSVASRIDMQKSFVNTLMDTIDKGVGNLIDADMSEESTKLQALQVKQQLGVQSLSIANQSAQSVLSLFRG